MSEAGPVLQSGRQRGQQQAAHGVAVGAIDNQVAAHCHFDVLVAATPITALAKRSGVKNPLGIRVSHNGSRIDTLVLLPRAAELYRLMPHKAAPDLSKFLLSPMPGPLADISVVPGQRGIGG